MLFTSRTRQAEETWMSASDLMTVLMILFLLIAIFYTIQKSQQAEEITKTADALIQTEEELCRKIKEKFSYLIKDNKIQVICSPITVRFIHPSYKFQSGSAELPVPFRNVLDSFFPALIKLIHSDNKYVHALEELRVEGHTSSEYKGDKGMESFQYNMGLSHARARAVVNYCLGLEPIKGDDPQKEELYKAREKWAFHNLTANGLSFAKLIRDPQNYKENKTASRRVEFKLITNTRDIIQGIKQKNLQTAAE